MIFKESYIGVAHSTDLYGQPASKQMLSQLKRRQSLSLLKVCSVFRLQVVFQLLLLCKQHFKSPFRKSFLSGYSSTRTFLSTGGSLADRGSNSLMKLADYSVYPEFNYCPLSLHNHNFFSAEQSFSERLFLSDDPIIHILLQGWGKAAVRSH